MFDHAGRIERLKSAMVSREVDLVLLSVGADLPYFTGYEAMASERLTVLVVGAERDPVLLIPELEAPRVRPQGFELIAWRETEDPIALTTSIGGEPGRVAVGDHMWSAFLVRFLAEWPDTKWISASELTADLRMRKDRIEIEELRRAARGIDIIMGRIPSEVRFSGRSEREVARDLADMTVEVGHDTAEFTIVASGPNSASPHHEPGDRIIESGDLVVCDFGGRWDGYYSDSTRTFCVGEPSVGQAEVYEVVRQANEAGRRAVVPGTSCESVDRATREFIQAAGYGDYLLHRTGHGIGLEVHEHPYIVEGNRNLLEPGMTFSIEPGVYLPGKLGVRIEDIVVCTADGVDSLNESSRNLVVVD